MRDDIISNINQRAEQLLSLQQPPRQPQELMSRGSVQQPELDIRDVDSSQMSLAPRPGAPPNPNIELIQQTLGLPRQSGTYPSGARRPNEVLFSAFKNNPQLLPSSVRSDILKLVEDDKELAKEERKAGKVSRSKISPRVAKLIADLIRKK